MSRVTVALVHYPCVDKHGEIYTTAVTNLDVHDIARTSCTYGIDAYYIVSPIEAQQKLAMQIASYWQDEKSKRKNADRARALRLLRVVSSVEEAIELESQQVCKPIVYATSAKSVGSSPMTYKKGRETISENQNNMIIFGTGHGLAHSVIETSHHVFEPLYGPVKDYNHLSVRSAAAIILDRLLAP